MSAYAWPKACNSDRKRMHICADFLGPRHLMHRVFHPDKPELLLPADELLRTGGFSSGERVMVRLAIDIWNGEAKLPVEEFLRLDPQNLQRAIRAVLQWHQL